jgi:hypothetical protein
MFGLGHVDLAPLIYGSVMFLGIWSMWSKFKHGQYQRLVIEVGVFALVFNLHGGTMTGGFSAMVCALLAGVFLGAKKKPSA